MHFNGREYTIKVAASGRVNLIGEHIDYCGGSVMPVALSLKNTVYARPNGTNFLNVRSTSSAGEFRLDIFKLANYKTLPHVNYIAGSAYMWQKAGHAVVGCDMLFDCSLPFGGGLSSSAAIEVSAIAALAAVAGEEPQKLQTALAAQTAECSYVGVRCGIMDQFAAACGKRGTAMLLNCKTLQCEYVPLNLGDCCLVAIYTGKPHALASSAYNSRRALVEDAFARLQPLTGAGCLAEVTSGQLKTFGGVLTEEQSALALHVVSENERVALAAQALRAGDVNSLGRLLNQSHASLRDLYRTTGVEADTLVNISQNHPACLGSRLTGGGFGGCTVSLVKREMAQCFKSEVTEEYSVRTGLEPVCYDVISDDGLTIER